MGTGNKQFPNHLFWLDTKSESLAKKIVTCKVKSKIDWNFWYMSISMDLRLRFLHLQCFSKLLLSIAAKWQKHQQINSVNNDSLLVILVLNIWLFESMKQAS